MTCDHATFPMFYQVLKWPICPIPDSNVSILIRSSQMPHSFGGTHSHLSFDQKLRLVLYLRSSFFKQTSKNDGCLFARVYNKDPNCCHYVSNICSPYFPFHTPSLILLIAPIILVPYCFFNNKQEHCYII